MHLDISSLPTRDIYHWMTRLINPRPIAWVSTLSREGIANLAPYSFFNGVGAKPPTLVFCPANDQRGEPKDTLVNIRQRGEFVVNVVTRVFAEQMKLTAAELDSSVDEFVFASVDKTESNHVQVPRVATALAAFECELMQVISLGAGPSAANLVIGRLVGLHVSDELFDQSGQFDSSRLDTIGRMGDSDYAATETRFSL
ncbi:flavin reductase family protein [Rubripirellula sp.]|nr:flavin reductase family protein [Rubripirellula sp.]MDB4339001.1 flavin reductase family protein [Rubripirellula sp.]